MKPITQANMFNFGTSVKSEPINISSSPIAPSSPTQARGKGAIKPPSFQTHSGEPRKLKVKNLRVSSKNKAEEYFNNTWKTLDAALSSIFAREKIAASMEELYRGVENICRSDRSPQLFEKLQSRMENYVQTGLQVEVCKRAQGQDVIGVARVVEEGWKQWSRQLVCIEGLLQRAFLTDTRASLDQSFSISTDRICSRPPA